MATIAMTGYSTTYYLFPYIKILLPDYFVWNPTYDDSQDLWGLSSQYLANQVPNILALDPEPTLLWVAIGGAWDMNRDPDTDSPYTISLENYYNNMVDSLNSLLTNTAIPHIVVANVVPIDRQSENQGSSPPYRFEEDAVLFRDKLQDVIDDVNDNRIIPYDYNQTIIDNNINQSDGIHLDDYDNILMSEILANYFKGILSDSSQSELKEKIDLTDAEIEIMPYSWGNGNGKSNSTSGNFPTPSEDCQPVEYVNIVSPAGFVYELNGSHIYCDSASPRDSISISKSVEFTNANDITIQISFDVETDNVNRFFAGCYDSGVNNWYMRIDQTNNVRFAINDGVTTRYCETKTPKPLAGYHTICFRKTNSEMQMFIDGIEVVEYNIKNDYDLGDLQPDANTRLGARWDGDSATFKGKIYWFVIYGKALTEQEILSCHHLGKSNGWYGYNSGDILDLFSQKLTIITNLVGSYLLENGSGSSAQDKSGNGKDITLTNTSWEDYGLRTNASGEYGTINNDEDDFVDSEIGTIVLGVKSIGAVNDGVQRCFVGNFTLSALQEIAFVKHSDNNLYAYLRDTSNHYVAIGAAKLSNWTTGIQIAMLWRRSGAIWNSDNIVINVDGVNQTPDTQLGETSWVEFNVDNPLYILNNKDDTTKHANSDLKYAYFYKRVLSEAELAYIYNNYDWILGSKKTNRIGCSIGVGI